MGTAGVKQVDVSGQLYHVPWRGSENYAPALEGGGIFCLPLLSRLPERLETRNMGVGGPA